MQRKLTYLFLLGAAVILPQAAQPQSWQATAGAQNESKGRQALAFFPNELWIHAGDSITWTFDANEKHTVTFLTPGQIRPSYLAGCPGITADNSTFDNSSCVNSGTVDTVASTYTVTFPTPGNYRLVCLVHANMTGIVHVLDPTEPLPHDQSFYNQQADAQRHDLMSDHDGHGHDLDGANAHPHDHAIVVGTGELVSTPGGVQSVSVMRFMQPSVTIHAGDTLEWSSDDVSGHTITFGQEPPNVSPSTPPSSNVFVDDDGARHAIVSSLSDNVHSGTITQAPQERTGLVQAPAGVTRFRVTFPNPGTYPYICAFHDEIGMVGQVIVLP